jgi:tetratricopeptide (TPR) repeat protein
MNKDPLLPRCGRQWNEPKCMDKPRRLPAQTAAKGLVLLLAWGLFLGEGPRAFAREDDPDLLNQRVVKLYQERKYHEAIPIAKKVLAIEKRALGPNHPNTATSLNNLAALYDAMGDYAKAEPLYQQALQIRKKALGPEHPDTATCLNSLAALYFAMGAYAKAEPLARLIANAIIYYNSAILSRLLTKYEASGNAKALVLIKKMSPTAWRHIHLNGHYTFRGDGQLIDLDAIVARLELG